MVRLCTIRLRQAHLRYRGVALLWTAVVMLSLILIVGLALDTAKVMLSAHQLQNAADAAALAGAAVVKFDQDFARAKAIEIAAQNRAELKPVVLIDNPSNFADGDIVIGRYDPETQLFTPTTDAADAVMVLARRIDDVLHEPVSLVFGPIANVNTANVARYAIAVASGGTGAGLIALAPDGTGLHIQGDFTVDVHLAEDANIPWNLDYAAIQVNSEDDAAVRIVGSSVQIEAEELNVVGDIDTSGGFDFPPEMDVDTNAAPLPDPLAWLPDVNPQSFLPDLSPSPGEPLNISSGVTVLEPGYYSGGLRITGGDVILKPGIYVLDGHSTGNQSGLVIGGNANFCAKGVMFYVTGDGVVDIAGTGVIEATELMVDAEFCDPTFAYPPGYGSWLSTYQGMTIFQDRQNTNAARIVGTGLMDIEGTLYFPRNLVDLRGEGDGFGNQLIAWRVEVGGTGNITINYDGRNASIGARSFLVK